MTKLGRRVTRIEQKRRVSGNTVRLIEIHNSPDCWEPTYAFSGDLRWELLPDESLPAFEARVRIAAGLAGQRWVMVNINDGRGDAVDDQPTC